MKASLLAIALVTTCLVSGCGDDDDGGASDPLSACKGIVNELCSKFYGCFTDAELELVPGIVGNNEADCRTKYEGERCSDQMLKCDSGETYSSAKAGECVSQYKSLSCDEFKNPATPAPAACDQVCQ